MQVISNYRGRFAPSPTGPLHFGSLVTAVASYLEAKKHKGIWLVRIEDIDTPRNAQGAADDILRTLEAFGLLWDETVLRQTDRTAAYEDALAQLKQIGMAYPCACSRKEISDSALHGIEGQIYPGTCRKGIAAEKRHARAWRVRADRLPHHASKWNGVIGFDDVLQGRVEQYLEDEIGDFVVKRADGLFAYQLAVVVDDAFQGITHVVRGTDLLASTARQIWLQRLLDLSTPAYFHLPIAVNAQGEKLSKQTFAAAVDQSQPVATLLRVLAFLRQEPPATLAGYDLETVWQWAHANWRIENLAGIKALPEN